MPRTVPRAVTYISTEAFAPSQRLDHWEAYNASFLIGLKCSSFSEEGLRATQSNMALGPLRLAHIRGNPHVVERTPQMVRQYPKESVFVSLMLDGHAFFYQGQECLTLEPGDLVIYDTRHAYLFGFMRQMRQLLLDASAEWFYRECSAALLDGPVRIAADSGSGRVLNNALRHLLSDVMARPDGIDVDLVRAQSCDLLQAMLTGEFRGSSALRASHLLTARAYIDEHLKDPALTAGDVAAAAGISLRHLNRLLQDEGRSVSQLIQERRLERATVELQRQALRRLSVGEIAYRCGFASQAHFARVFRARHGVTPTQMRRQSPPFTVLG